MPDPSTIRFLDRIHPVSRETLERLVAYEALLRRWQAKTNLVAPGTLDHFWTRHVADSLQVLSIAGERVRFCDLGSGGGFPGMVLAIALRDLELANTVPETHSPPETHSAHVDLIESNGKKCAFLRAVARQTGARAIIHCKRIESAAEQISTCERVTARALAPLSVLLDLCGEHLTGGRKAIFHKGRDYQRELQDCRGKWEFDLLVHKSVLAGPSEGDSVLLEIGNVRQTRGSPEV